MGPQSSAGLDIEAENQRLLALPPQLSHASRRLPPLRVGSPALGGVIGKRGWIRSRYQRNWGELVASARVLVVERDPVAARVGVGLERRREPVGEVRPRERSPSVPCSEATACARAASRNGASPTLYGRPEVVSPSSRIERPG